MSERAKPKQLIKARIARGPLTVHDTNPLPRDQVVYRDGKPTILTPLLCRLHNLPWQTCPYCSKPKR